MEVNLGHILILVGMGLGLIKLWFKREKDIEFLSNESQRRYEANANRLGEIDDKIKGINERGTMASARELDALRKELEMLEQLFADQQQRLNALEEIKPQLATLVERSSNQSESMKEMKEQLRVIISRISNHDISNHVKTSNH